MWHVTITYAGDPVTTEKLLVSLQRLSEEHPFLLTSRYAEDRAELRYWDQARDLHDAAAMALRLWGEHRHSCDLPDWEVVGLEVVERDTWHFRRQVGDQAPRRVAPAGGIRPF